MIRLEKEPGEEGHNQAINIRTMPNLDNQRHRDSRFLVFFSLVAPLANETNFGNEMQFANAAMKNHGTNSKHVRIT
jgi:hypothetical protein